MELIIYEELYQTPFKFDFKLPCNGKADCVKMNNCNGRYNFNGDSNAYLLRNHQNRTVVSRTTKISQEGLEMRAQNQEVKRIKIGNKNFISLLLKQPIQSKRSRRHRHKRKYCDYSTGDY